MELNELMFAISNLSTFEKIIMLIIIIFMCYLVFKIVQDILHPGDSFKRKKDRELIRVDKYIRDTVCTNVINIGLTCNALYESLSTSYVNFYYWITQFDNYVNRILGSIQIKDLKTTEYAENYDNLCELSNRLHDLRIEYFDLLLDNKIEPRATSEIDKKFAEYEKTFEATRKRLKSYNFKHIKAKDIKKYTQMVYDISTTASTDYSSVTAQFFDKVATEIFSIIDNEIDYEVSCQFGLIGIGLIGTNIVENIRSNVDLLAYTSNNLGEYLTKWLDYAERVRDHIEFTVDDGKADILLQEGIKIYKNFIDVGDYKHYYEGFIMSANLNQFKIWMIISLFKDYLKNLKYSDSTDEIKNMSDMVRYGEKYGNKFVSSAESSESYFAPYIHIFNKRYMNDDDYIGIKLPNDIGFIKLQFNKKEFHEFINYEDGKFASKFMNSCDKDLKVFKDIHKYTILSYGGIEVLDNIVEELLNDENK